MLLRSSIILLLVSVLPAGYVTAGTWDPVGGSYYELSTCYSVRSYRPLKGSRDAVFTGLQLHENNGIIGTYLLTMAVDRETELAGGPERTAARGETDLHFYFNAMGGDVGGFDWNFYLGAVGPATGPVLKLGLGMGMVHGLYETDAGVEGKWSSFKLGVPVRLVWCPWPRHLRLTADLDINFLSIFSRDRGRTADDGNEILFAPSPAALGAVFSPLERMLLYGGVMLPGSDEGMSVGMYGGAGVRF